MGKRSQGNRVGEMIQKHMTVFNLFMTLWADLYPTLSEHKLAEMLDARCEHNGWRVQMPIKKSGQWSEVETQPG